MRRLREPMSNAAYALLVAAEIDRRKLYWVRMRWRLAGLRGAGAKTRRRDGASGIELALRFRKPIREGTMEAPTNPQTANAAPNASCKICTIRLEALCYERAWWFRAFREVLATGIRLFAIASLIRPKDYLARSPMCYKCLRFRKNALKARSPLFNWLDSYLNPLFNRVRDSLLTADELDRARALARRAEDPSFIDYRRF